MSNPEWKTIPWELHSKTQKDRLLDILIEIPTLLEESDLLLRSSDNNNDETQEEEKYHRQRRLIDHCWLCDEQLTQWYETMTLCKENSQAFKATKNSIMVDTMDLGSVHLMTLYWSTCVLLYGVLRQTIDPQEDIDLLPKRTDIKTYCRKIVRAIPLFFHPAVGAFRAYLSTFPMYVVILHLSVFGEEERKTEVKLLEDCYDTPEGMTVGRFMKSVELEALRA